MPVSKKPKTFLPYGRQSIDQADIDAVIEVLKGDYLTTGPAVLGFENALSQRVNARVVAVNSGTAALHLAMKALGVGKGDWVIVPAIAFLSTANAALFCGAEVVFADVDAETGLMGPAQFKEALERAKDKHVKAVVPVHIAGQTERLSEIYRIAKAQDLWVIEDACHAIGTHYTEGEFHYPIGQCKHSDITIFSFHPVKTIAMGEGGAIATQDEALYRKVMLLRTHGMIRERDTFLHEERAVSTKGKLNPWYYEMQELGLNYRVSDMHCALGLSQLKKLNDFVLRRRKLTNLYDALLAPLAPVLKPIQKTAYSDPGWHLYSVLIDFNRLSIDRAELMMALREQGVGTQVLYIPVNEQPYYESRYGMRVLAGAQAYYNRTLSLPLYPALTEEDVEYVVESLTAILEAA